MKILIGDEGQMVVVEMEVLCWVILFDNPSWIVCTKVYLPMYVVAFQHVHVQFLHENFFNK